MQMRCIKMDLDGVDVKLDKIKRYVCDLNGQE